MPSSLHRLLAPLLVLIAAAWTRPAAAQSAPLSRLEPSSAAVAVLPVALYTAQANLREPSDSSKSGTATAVLTERLRELLGNQAIMGDRVAALLASRVGEETRGDQPCNVIVACVRAVAKELKAPWVVMAKVSKTSNLIWLLTGQLIQTSTGRIVLDDSTELKGEPEGMVRAGTRIFAERVARAVKNGGVVTNYPGGELR
jgi:uncharacterized protein DUF2380